MNKIIKRVFQICSLGSLAIASCQMKYGMPIDIDPYKAVKTQTENNLPIKGLSVKLIQNSDTVLTGNTDVNGVLPFNFDFYNTEGYSVLIEDVDGDENQGQFISKEVVLTEPDTTIITMEKNEDIL